MKLNDRDHVPLGHDDDYSEAAYLVARGVRLVAQVGTCAADEPELLRAATVVERWSEAGAIAFVIKTRTGHAAFGYAAQRWALELFEWVVTDDVPEHHRHRILGMLFGYAPDAIRRFEEQRSGRTFADRSVSESGAPASS